MHSQTCSFLKSGILLAPGIQRKDGTIRHAVSFSFRSAVALQYMRHDRLHPHSVGIVGSQTGNLNVAKTAVLVELKGLLYEKVDFESCVTNTHGLGQASSGK